MALCAFTLIARAEKAEDNSITFDKSITFVDKDTTGLGERGLTVLAAKTIDINLRAFDGYKKIVPSTNPGVPDQIVIVPYELSGRTRMAIAENLSALKPTIDAFEIANGNLSKSFGKNGADVDQKDQEAMAKYIAELTQILKRPVSVNLVKIPLADLNLDHNPVPPSVISALAPVIAKDPHP